MWHKFNPNPHGSSVGDCAVRAVAAATGRSWEQAYISLALTGYALGDMPSANRTWGAYLQKQGYKRRMVEADCATCYTVANFAREYPRGVYVLGCSGHVLAVIDGEWWDRLRQLRITESRQLFEWLFPKWKCPHQNVQPLS